MKKCILILLALHCAAPLLLGQDTEACGCFGGINDKISPNNEFAKMSMAAEKLKPPMLDTLIKRIEKWEVNKSLQPDPSYNTLVQEIIPMCKGICSTLDVAPGSAIHKLIGAKENVRASNFSAYKAVITCFALQQEIARQKLPPPEDKGKKDTTIRNRREEVEPTNATNETNWWMMLSIGLALGLVGVLLYFMNKVKRLTDQLNLLSIQFEVERGEFKERIARLQTELDLRRKTGQGEREDYTPPVQPPPKVETPPPASPPTVAPSKRIYLRPPNGNIFSKVSDVMSPYETYYMIDIHPDGKTGVLRLTNDVATLEHAFSMIDVLRDACDLMGNNQPSSAAQANQVPGAVEITNDGHWRITEKIKLSW